MASLSTCHLELIVWDGNLVKLQHHLLWEAFTIEGRLLILLYSPMAVARYSFIQPRELKQRGVNRIAQVSRQQEDLIQIRLQCSNCEATLPPLAVGDNKTAVF